MYRELRLARVSHPRAAPPDPEAEPAPRRRPYTPTGRSVGRPRGDPEERFWALVDAAGPVADLRPELGPCWPWGGSCTPAGYSRLWVGDRWVHAHAFAWGLAGGEQPPAGMRFEHFACSRRWCVNPGHVRPLVAEEDELGARFLAGWILRHGRCPSGHLVSPGNRLVVPGGLSCRTCRADTARRRRAARRGV